MFSPISWNSALCVFTDLGTIILYTSLPVSSDIFFFFFIAPWLFSERSDLHVLVCLLLRLREHEASRLLRAQSCPSTWRSSLRCLRRRRPRRHARSYEMMSTDSKLVGRVLRVCRVQATVGTQTAAWPVGRSNEYIKDFNHSMAVFAGVSFCRSKFASSCFQAPEDKGCCHVQGTDGPCLATQFSSSFMRAIARKNRHNSYS